MPLRGFIIPLICIQVYFQKVHLFVYKNKKAAVIAALLCML